MLYDAIVIGGGPAGLQAALTIGRMHREVLLLDSGEYRNATVSHGHNLVTNDGRDPAELRATARAELAAYPTVEVRDRAAESVSGTLGDFRVTLADGIERARRVVLATGMRDELPPVPGLAEQWGRR
uniref:NAD(P)/FAD-dependent oxidoreductase n=1 Tax=Microbacterium sp. CPCC 204701 TaxID=2493084 RepID=UPI0013E2E744